MFPPRQAALRTIWDIPKPKNLHGYQKRFCNYLLYHNFAMRAVDAQVRETNAPCRVSDAQVRTFYAE